MQPKFSSSEWKLWPASSFHIWSCCFGFSDDDHRVPRHTDTNYSYRICDISCISGVVRHLVSEAEAILGTTLTKNKVPHTWTATVRHQWRSFQYTTTVQDDRACTRNVSGIEYHQLGGRALHTEPNGRELERKDRFPYCWSHHLIPDLGIFPTSRDSGPNFRRARCPLRGEAHNSEKFQQGCDHQGRRPDHSDWSSCPKWLRLCHLYTMVG